MQTTGERAVRERGLIFSAWEVRAILEGRKTVTRRPVKPQPPSGAHVGDVEPHPRFEGEWFYWLNGCEMSETFLCPFGQPGDRLWGRETWVDMSTGDMRAQGKRPCWYRADYSHPDAIAGFRWSPSIHMPRWASRITIEVTGVRVERLQEITEEQAIAEGCGIDTKYMQAPPRVDFSMKWEQIYGLQSWIDNPWVWVVKFQRVM